MELAPHKQHGVMIAAGIKKEGHQTHVHIIVSRRDQTNTYTLSPMAKHKASEVELNGKLVKRGFDRDKFFEAAEKTFDRVSGFNRNYVESYGARKTYLKEPHRFVAKVLGLPTKEKDIALKVQMALKIVKALKKGVGQARDTGMEIGY